MTFIFALLSVFCQLAGSAYSFGAKKTLSVSKCDSPDFHAKNCGKTAKNFAVMFDNPVQYMI